MDGEDLQRLLVHRGVEEVIGGETRTPLHLEADEAEAEAGTEAGTLIDAYRLREEVNLPLLREVGGVAVRDLVRGRPGGEDTIRRLLSLTFGVPAPVFVAFPSQNAYVVCIVLPISLP